MLIFPPISNCPACYYPLRGLPPRHNCPECGFECDANSIVVRRAAEWTTAVETSGPAFALILLACAFVGALTLRFGLALSTAVVLAACGLAAALAWRQWVVAHGPTFIALMPDRVEVRLAGVAHRIEWPAIKAASIGERNPTIEFADGRLPLRLRQIVDSPDDTLALVHAINSIVKAGPDEHGQWPFTERLRIEFKALGPAPRPPGAQGHGQTLSLVGVLVVFAGLVAPLAIAFLPASARNTAWIVVFALLFLIVLFAYLRSRRPSPPADRD